MKPAHRAVAVALTGLAVALLGSAARAECDHRANASACISSDVLWAMPGRQRFAHVATTELPPPGSFALALVTTYQKRPIELYAATPGVAKTDTPAIDDQLNTTFVPSFAVASGLAVYGAFPATLYETGGGTGIVTGRPAPATSGLRDPRLGVAIAMLSRAPAPSGGGGDTSPGSFAVTAYGDVQAPTGLTPDFNGERGFVFSPTVAADLRVVRRILVAAELGARVRPAPQTFFGERQTTQVLLGLAGSVDVLARELLSIGAEARAIAGIDARADASQSAFGPNTTNARTILGGEWLASARTSLFGGGLTVLGGAGGTLPFDGLIGIGRWRAVLGVTYAPTTAPAREAPSQATSPTARVVPENGAPAAAPPTSDAPCTTICKADSFSMLPREDELDLAPRITPFLMELRECLDRVRADNIRPATLLRFSDAGTLLQTRVDVGGYENLTCVKDVASRPPTVSVSHGTTVRCELRCR